MSYGAFLIFKSVSSRFEEISQFLYHDFTGFVCPLLSSIVFVRTEGTALSTRHVLSVAG